MKKQKLTQVQIVALGFFIIVCIGTALLMLPTATVAGEKTSLLTAMFTAVSASCVTGLIRVDTATHWTVFGQLVIILLIQLGGLGYMTVSTFFLTFIKKNIGIKKRALFAESINTLRISGLKKLTARIIKGTALFEGLGAILLSVRFIPQFGTWQGIYYAVFHSVSAFCNAGFDLMGKNEAFSSLVNYDSDWFVCTVIMVLISVGGIGFLVWDDILEKRFRLKRLSLHTKLVLCVSALLTFGGAALFFVFDNNSAFADKATSQKILCALFQSVTCRTAGFNTVDLTSLSDASVLLSCFLMFIGGSSGSTAGGIKTTTVAVLILYAESVLRGKKEVTLFNRRLKDDAVKKAIGVFVFNFMLVLIASCILTSVDKLELNSVIFETFSAAGTVGMSTGITRELSTISAVTVMILMFCGRVGSVSLATALIEKRNPPPVRCPSEDITIG